MIKSGVRTELTLLDLFTGEATGSTLHPELIEMIIGHLAVDRANVLTLTSLNLVSHGFHSVCRPFVFYRVDLGPARRGLDDASPPRYCRRSYVHFQHLVSRSPEISLLVRRLHLSLHIVPPQALNFWDGMSQVVRGLINIQEVSIADCSWNRTQSEAREAIIAAIAQPNVKKVSLSTFYTS